MNRIKIPVDTKSGEVRTFDVTSFFKDRPERETNFDLTVEGLSKLAITIEGVTFNSIEHPETVTFSGSTISVRFSDWPLKIGTNNIVSMRVYETDATSPKATLCGPFMFTQIIVVGF